MNTNKLKNKTKSYKNNPKHLFWFNDGCVEKIRPIGGGLNLYESVNLKTYKRSGAFIRGYLLQAGATKASEADFESALANVL
jgi:hypothetical protein